MLREHLSQDHDAASRRLRTLERQVRWIHRELLGGRSSLVLDLGCGPGLYTRRLAELGHRCSGIDFSPAAIRYADAEAAAKDLSCEYRLSDLREGGFGTGFRLALLIHGEFNAFRRAEARKLLADAAAALDPGGMLTLELHSSEFVRRVGERPASWYASSSGLLSERPHVCLKEASWNEKECAALEVYYAVDADTAEVKSYTAPLYAWSDEELRGALEAAGFGELRRHASLEGGPSPGQEHYFVINARVEK